MARGLGPASNAVEVAHTHIGGQVYSGNGASFFDGTLTLAPSYDVTCLGLPSHYVEFSVQVKCWLWQNADSYPSWNAALKIEKWDGAGYVDTGETITRPQSAGWHKGGYLFEAGRYRLSLAGTGTRVDNEWFFECAETTALPDCFHPRNFTSATKDGWDAAWSTGNYGAGYEAWRAFNNDPNDRALANGTTPASLILTAPAGQTFVCGGVRRFNGAGGAQGYGAVVFEALVGGTWEAMWNTELQASNVGVSNSEPYTVVWAPKTGSAFRMRYTTASYGDTAELSFIGAFSDPMFLVRDPADGALKTWNSTSWDTVKASGDPDDADYAAGMNRATFVAMGESAFALLGVGNVEVYVRDKAVPNVLTTDAIPPAQTIVQSADYSLAGIDNIDSFTLTANVSGSGAVRALVSADSGTSWSAWNGTSWDSVALGDIGTQGMSSAVLNAVPSAAWNDLILPTRTVRFAYWISKTALGDAAQIDALASQLDMAGTWVESLRGTDYNVEWGNNFLRVRILAAGSWKVNYRV